METPNSMTIAMLPHHKFAQLSCWYCCSQNVVNKGSLLRDVNTYQHHIDTELHRF